MAPFPLLAVLGSVVAGGLGFLGASKQAGAATEAGEAGLQASRESIAEQRRQFDIALELTGPRREAENEALNALRGLLGLGGEAPDFSAFERSPGFEFTRDEALRGVERSAAARGGLVSGNTLAALEDRAAGLAGQNFLSTFLNPLQDLALGGSAATAGQNALNLGVNVGNTIQEGAASRASGLIGSANAFSGGLGNLNQAIQGGISNVLLQQILNKQASRPISVL